MITNTGPDYRVYGCIPVVIGAMLQHKLTFPLTLDSGRILAAGGKIHLEVEDLSQVLDTKDVKWVCRHPECAGQAWKTKAELIAGHLPKKALAAAMETHLYVAILNMPYRQAVEEQRAKNGELLVAAIEKKDATIRLLSDEDMPR